MDTRNATIIRDAREGDLSAILDIHNANIATSTAIWDIDEVGIDERQSWFRSRVEAGMPVLVAEVDGEVAGYASYGQWRPKVGYRYSVENSVYIADRFQRRGLASALLTELIDRAATSGRVHAMIAAIESSNTGSIALHERFGFVVVGQLPEVGHKFGRWMDLTLMQLTLPVEVD
ncbi:phosphinothricin acetyltransferase [Nocardia amikacinitolerans]|uniref:GNAT family N-acetyltransferase n=1 Tax=Nocardia amikacinitolerans TaxID=756689 RepID=UPI00083650FF|nr:GNAT family N-acetyltransferase [Nocardia amikacinitolerans]MCP2318251.1 phosphinothricin acetyltransferase [Nocardia amikacinitolerans]